FLKDEGITTGSLVGICLGRSVEVMVALFGTMKSGGAYLPIDPGYPEDRIRYMLQDAKVRVLLTEHSRVELLRRIAPDVKIIALDTQDFSGCADHNPQVPLSANDLAYVLYTSGSTGKPKGVMVQHGGVVNYLSHVTQRFDAAAGDGGLVVTPVTFDLTITGL